MTATDSVAGRHAAPETASVAPAIELRGISKAFGPVQANKDISMTVPRGTIHGIVGENGAGKSTLMSILYGFYRPDAGQILIGGVQHPLRAVERLDHRGQCLWLADRVEQKRAGAGATQLNEVRTLRVSISRGAFGVDGDGAGSGGKAFGGIGEVRRAGQHRWNTVGWCE